MIKGHCLCGRIQFETTARPEASSMCHCSQCRRQSGGIWSSAHVAEEALHITGDVSWYNASPEAQRGFCATCGSFLFWKRSDEDTISFSLGAIDNPTGLKLEKHIFVAEKGDYYDIADGVTQQS